MINKSALTKIQYPEIRELIEDLYALQLSIFGDKYIGMYLYGSLVWGDFNLRVSDLDLLVVLTEKVNGQELSQLEVVHKQIIQKFPTWDDRIEVQYISKEDLVNFRKSTAKMVNISPGEPIHFVEGGIDWLMNWFFVQEYGLTISGPKPETLIPKISKEEFMKELIRQVRLWEKRIENEQNDLLFQSYAILTMCRAYYTYKLGEQVSKEKAASWVFREYPEWRYLIEKALHWRENSNNLESDPTKYSPSTKEFIGLLAEQIV